uniref:Large ribosomal subunit protein uL23c n=1 Tax=Compsothamnion thuioides TaxID=3097386 RepID=A0A4D6WQB6_9FLOR|nr:ribosomal protein L23 [Compsothamnion thuyoides]
MIKKNINKNLLNIIKYPIITDKTSEMIEDNIYCFAVAIKANKTIIKKAVEYIFDVKIKNINTLKQPTKKKRIGKFYGTKTKYKKAIIKLYDEYKINLFNEA